MSTRMIDFRFAPSQQWTPICRPDDPFKTLTRQDGALLYDFQNDWSLGSWCFGRIVELRLHTDAAPKSITQQTESAAVPIVVTRVEYEHAILTLRAAGHLDESDRRFDVVEWTIESTGLVPRLTTALVVELQQQSRYFAPAELCDTDRYAAAFAAEPCLPGKTVYAYDPSRASLYLPHLSAVPPAGEQRRAEFLDAQREPVLTSTAGPLRMCPAQGGRPSSALRSDFVILAPGQSVSGHLVLPLEPGRLADGELDRLDEAWAAGALDAERAFWSAQRFRRTTIAVPDERLDAMLTACARNMFQARDVVDGKPEFQVGCAFFRGVWIVDSYFMLEAARYLGLADDAASGLDVILRRVKADGSICQIPAHKKETAIALATLARQTELGGDWERLRELWPTVQAAIQHIHDQLESMRQLPPDHPAYGLTPESFGDGGIGGLRHDYTTVYWTLVGLDAIAEAARQLGFDDDAKAARADADQLLVDFRRSAARDRRTTPGGVRYIPSVLPGSGDHNWVAGTTEKPPPWHTIQPETATWALCQAIYPGEVFGADDPVTTDLLALFDSRDDEQGIPATTGFLTHEAIWTYAGSFAAHAWLAAGHPDKAVDYLYAYANHASPTGVWREEQSLTASRLDQLSGDMPTNWASAELIRLVRNFVVLERRSTLSLLAGVPVDWLRPGHRVAVLDTPTRFGAVSVEAVVDDAGRATVTVNRDLTWPRQPERVTLRIPGGEPPTVLVNGVPVEPSAYAAAPSGATVDLPSAPVVAVQFTISESA